MNTAAPEKPRPERPPKLPNRFPQKFDEQSVTLNDKFDDSAWVFVLGVGLDPEVITAGVHAKLGPFFNRNTVSRPNAEFAFFGEVTTLVALNVEAVYRLPTPRQSRWSVYVGGGPGLELH